MICPECGGVDGWGARCWRCTPAMFPREKRQAWAQYFASREPEQAALRAEGCKMQGCERQGTAPRGLCAMHYGAALRERRLWRERMAGRREALRG